ncbi:hypothetical protein CDV36_011189 [Fusarium kuroshium]|uniref:Uncharacterized protein n=1 Tax=Fusarium kuroshium TaxID=2010991 RepID=A0A3M2RV70_9HYPO|nr:hypothetical protein CDV36_011189 [Fusarium kuroshium]
MTPVWPPKLNIPQDSSSLQVAAISYQISHKDASPHPTIRLHTPAVNFIEKQLSEYREAFYFRRDEIFPSAIELLNNKDPTQSKYGEEWGIRHLTKWQDVEAKLEKARQVYDFETGSQNVGKVYKKVRGLTDDHHVIAQQATELVPNSKIATPIISVINLMVDTYSKASQVQQEVDSSLEDLPIESRASTVTNNIFLYLSS